MCDYSLEQQRSRPAVAGDRLVTSAFRDSATIGFTARDDRTTAVCLSPGAEIAFARPVIFSGLFSALLQAGQHECCMARFRQVNAGNPLVHHDALEFGNGQVVLLTHLRVDQQATVIQLPAGAERVLTPAGPAAASR